MPNRSKRCIALLAALLLWSGAVSGCVPTGSSQETSSQEASSQEVSSQEVSSQEVSSQEVSSQKTSSQEASSQEVSSQEVSSQEVSSQEVSSQEVSSQEVSSQEVSSQEASSQEASSQEVSSQETSSQEVSSQEVSSQEASSQEASSQEMSSSDGNGDLNGEGDALTESPPAIPLVMSTVASGTLVKQNAQAVIDYSNTADGYVMVRYTASTSNRLKAQVKGPTTAYTYNLTQGQWAAFPFSDGNGSYQITVYENVVDSKYAAVLSLTHDVRLVNEFAPFLHSNQYVNYDAAPQTVNKAYALTRKQSDALKKVETVYDFVVGEISYDKKLASSVKSGYLPDLDAVLQRKKGICFDYAALMTGMLRSQGVPCKLVVGYAGETYHAWISVWTKENGWVDGVIYFDGSKWQRMDPTFASSAGNSDSILQYIGDGTNYTAKYFY